MQGAEQSPSAEGTIERISIEYKGNLAYKKYIFGGFLTHQALIQELTNEYAVLEQARKQELFNIVQLKKVCIGKDHVLLGME